MAKVGNITLVGRAASSVPAAEPLAQSPARQQQASVEPISSAESENTSYQPYPSDDGRFARSRAPSPETDPPVAASEDMSIREVAEDISDDISSDPLSYVLEDPPDECQREHSMAPSPKRR